MFIQKPVNASLLTLLCCLALATLCAAQAKPQTGPVEPIAIVAGQPIFEQDLMSVAGPSLLELRKQEYKLKSDALNQSIRKKLIEVEAKKKGLSTEELLKQEVDSKIAEPSEDEAKGYYIAVKSQTTLPFDQIKSQVKHLLRTAEVEQAREKYADSLRDKAEVSILLQTSMVQVDYDPARVKGDPQAPVTIVEFSDFQCPFCKQTEPVLNSLLDKYNGRVKLAYMDFPLREIHPHAESAAEASRCAAEQGKFWEFHDSLFADASKLDNPDLIERARTLGLRDEPFRACLASGKFKASVDADREAGIKAGVGGTPGFFINGVPLSGAQSPAEFEKIIDTQLSLVGHHSAQ